MKGRRETVDSHILMRKSFPLSGAPSSGHLHIAASDQYRLFVNGRWVGDGPARSEVPNAYVDRYALHELHLRRGENVIALLLHNTMMPQHGQSLCPGGVWLELECRRGRSAVRVATDSSWRVIAAPHYAKPAPRRFFPVGFNEHYLADLEPRGWTELGFDDRAWSRAVKVESSFFRNLIPRPVPRLTFEFWKPVLIRRRGTVGPLDGIHGLAFRRCRRPRAPKEATFHTSVYSDKDRPAIFRFGSDNWSRVLLNGRLIWEQGEPTNSYVGHLDKIRESIIPRSFAHGQRLEDYTGMVYGNGLRMEPAASRESAPAEKPVALRRGWNRLDVWVYRPDLAYGFELCFLEPEKRTRIKTIASSTRDSGRVETWSVHTGTPGASPRLVETAPGDMRPWLEPSHLADWDEQRETRRPPQGARSILSSSAQPGAMVLTPGEFVEFQLQADGTGFLELDVSGPKGAVVEATISEAQTRIRNGRIRSIYNGLWQTDRIVLSGRRDRWHSFDRRSGRYLALCIRHATGPVTVHRFGLRTQHYPADREGSFQCSDAVFNRMWEAGAATVKASSFDLVEDCPTREKAQWLQDTYIRMFLLAVLWGDLRMSAKGIREFAEDQKPDRWSRPCVPSGYGDKLVEGCFLLPMWVMDHYRLSGDRTVLEDSFQGVKNLLGYARSLKDRIGFPRPDPDPRNIIYIDYSMLPTARCGDTIGVMQCHYVIALEESARQAELLGQPGQAAAWREEAVRMRDLIRRYFWVEKAGLFSDGIREGKSGGTFNAITNYWMLLSNTATPEQEKRILGRLWHSPRRENLAHWPRGESPYSKHYVSEVLLRRGLWMQTFAMWRGFYGNMLRHPESWCVPEMWNRKWPLKEPIPRNSLVHAFGIGPMAHLALYVAGVRPLSHQPTRLLWEPMPGDLSWLKARLPLVGSNDMLSVEWKSRPSGGRTLVLRRPRGIEVRASERFLSPGDRMKILDA